MTRRQITLIICLNLLFIFIFKISKDVDRDGRRRAVEGRDHPGRHEPSGHDRQGSDEARTS